MIETNSKLQETQKIFSAEKYFSRIVYRTIGVTNLRHLWLSKLIHSNFSIYFCVLSQSAQTRVLIKGGRVVNHDLMEDADVYIEDGLIKWVLTGEFLLFL